MLAMNALRSISSIMVPPSSGAVIPSALQYAATENASTSYAPDPGMAGGSAAATYDRRSHAHTSCPPARAMSLSVPTARRLPIGAELIDATKAHFRVWAPVASRVDVVLYRDDAETVKRTHPMEADADGYF